MYTCVQMLSLNEIFSLSLDSQQIVLLNLDRQFDSEHHSTVKALFAFKRMLLFAYGVRIIFRNF